MDPSVSQCRTCYAHDFEDTERGGAVRVPGAVPVFHGCWQRRAHICLHHGRGTVRLQLPHVLVRAKCREPERGSAGRLYVALPEMLGRSAPQPGLLSAHTSSRLSGSQGQERRADPAGQLQKLQIGLTVSLSLIRSLPVR